MRARRLLIVYGTSHGQTAKIATRIRDALAARGHDVSLMDAGSGDVERGLDRWDGVIVGSSVIAHGHQRRVRNFVARHRDLLNALPSAFYSVSASAGSEHAASRVEADRLRTSYLARAGWRPALSASIAGAINFTRYGWLLRWYMKRASAVNGGSVDTSRDHEYTDWQQVERFAAAFAHLVEQPEPWEIIARVPEHASV
jgi:menaquinone-dependent protoporphyrinogen oxidase